jgi:hypothetical protein
LVLRLKEKPMLVNFDFEAFKQALDFTNLSTAILIDMNH